MHDVQLQQCGKILGVQPEGGTLLLGHSIHGQVDVAALPVVTTRPGAVKHHLGRAVLPADFCNLFVKFVHRVIPCRLILEALGTWLVAKSFCVVFGEHTKRFGFCKILTGVLMIILFVVSANDVSLIECQFKHILIVTRKHELTVFDFRIVFFFQIVILCIDSVQ